MENEIVVGVIIFNKKILILKRTSDREFSPNKWQPVSGFIDKNETKEEACLREVKEETGLNGKIIKKGEKFKVIDDYGSWIINAFLISVDSDKIIMDIKEHSEYVWIKPEDIIKFDSVKGIEKDLESVGLL